jgi:hypothetical protein
MVELTSEPEALPHNGRLNRPKARLIRRLCLHQLLDSTHPSRPHPRHPAPSPVLALNVAHRPTARTHHNAAGGCAAGMEAHTLHQVAVRHTRCSKEDLAGRPATGEGESGKEHLGLGGEHRVRILFAADGGSLPWLRHVLLPQATAAA